MAQTVAYNGCLGGENMMSSDAYEGINLALSPVQLAAILSNSNVAADASAVDSSRSPYIFAARSTQIC